MANGFTATSFVVCMTVSSTQACLIFIGLLSPGSWLLAPGTGNPSVAPYSVRLEEREAGGFIDNTKHIMFEDEIESSQGAGQPSDHGAFAQSTALASSVRPLCEQ
ncbi:hypothetical protein THAOC_15161 [Thalassiosira oceanica]|uniref:Uncharacterized protein n=1 Tax=Thalassiosira oceanica TaxID=159749 RepID=K0SDH3_THAOC|nr:hypothetical protein THAOC_15161 [Thalassiosira oceanica]|eukprot:EJK64138.1 hypothetical protein THAOC_15161 [Thalassiosira oceanica]